LRPLYDIVRMANHGSDESRLWIKKPVCKSVFAWQI
jgi:hypothetical protein